MVVILILLTAGCRWIAGESSNDAVAVTLRGQLIEDQAAASYVLVRQGIMVAGHDRIQPFTCRDSSTWPGSRGHYLALLERCSQRKWKVRTSPGAVGKGPAELKDGQPLVIAEGVNGHSRPVVLLAWRREIGVVQNDLSSIGTSKGP